MDKALILIFLIGISCKAKKPNNNIEMRDKTVLQNSTYLKQTFLFNDSNYILSINVFDTTISYDFEKPNTTLKLTYATKVGVKVLTFDSLYCKTPEGADPEISIELQDFNNDNSADLLLPFASDPRGNHGYHLYLVDSKNKIIKRVKGFEDVANPQFDSTNNIITSCTITSPPFYNFYAIDSTNTIIDLGHSFSFPLNLDTLETDNMFRKAIQQIVFDSKNNTQHQP